MFELLDLLKSPVLDMFHWTYLWPITDWYIDKFKLNFGRHDWMLPWPYWIFMVISLIEMCNDSYDPENLLLDIIALLSYRQLAEPR